MAQGVNDMPSDPVLVVIEDDGPTMTFDDWLQRLALGEPSDVEVGAAGSLSEIREHGER